MEFFNRKEEVIDIQITPYGKHKLSLGKFKPSYYAFFDSDIVYNTYFNTETGYSENQKDTEGRIKEMIRPKAQSIRYGVESKINHYIDEQSQGQVNILQPAQIGAVLENLRQPVDPKENSATLRNPIGNSAPNSYYLPSWKVSSLLGRIDYSEPSYTGSIDYRKQIIENIPQVNINIEYKTQISNILETGGENTTGIDLQLLNKYEDTSFYSSDVYEDGTQIFVQKQFSLLDIIEEHVGDNIHNFDIEVYEIVKEPYKDSNGSIVIQEDLKKLKFRKNDYLELGQNQLFTESLYNSTQIDDSYVEYYFEIKVDEEIEDVVRSETAQLVDQTENLPINNFEEPC